MAADRPAVVFDLGKVLLDFDYGICIEKFLKFTPLPAAEVRKIIGQSSLLFRFETGLLTSQEFFEELQGLSAFRAGYAEFTEMFSDIFEPIPAMIEMQANLRAHGYPTYVFSNTNPFAIDHIRERYPFFNQFDGHILSYEHRAMKPDPQLYEVVEKISGRSGPALVYIDDRPENIEAGLARGWRAVHHLTPEQTREQLKHLGLPSSAKPET